MAINRYAAIAWIYSNQLGRRNLTNEQKHYLIGKQYEAQKAAQGASDGFRGNQYVESGKSQKAALTKSIEDEPPKNLRTAEKIGKEHGVGKNTVKQDEKFAKGVDEAEKLSPVFLKLRFQKYGVCYFPK